MFRLIKLGFYALIGYAIYEIYQGMTSEHRLSDRSLGRQGARQGVSHPSGIGSRDNAENMSGPARGQVEESQEGDGGSTPHRVGRGVTAS
jgi:hypothetical protein